MATGCNSIKELFMWYTTSKLNPLISNSYPLNKASDALLDLAERRAIGRIIVKPNNLT